MVFQGGAVARVEVVEHDLKDVAIARDAVGEGPIGAAEEAGGAEGVPEMVQGLAVEAEVGGDTVGGAAEDFGDLSLQGPGAKFAQAGQGRLVEGQIHVGLSEALESLLGTEHGDPGSLDGQCERCLLKWRRKGEEALGKPYQLELEQLADTYRWAVTTDVVALRSALLAVSDVPLIVVGSGGSLSVAHLAAWLQERETGWLARVCTPLELLHSGLSAAGCGVLLVSAGGRNPDIVAALRDAIRREPHWISVICGTRGTPLGRLASSVDHASVVEYSIPAGKDGFLATNSLLAFSTLLLRASTDPQLVLPMTFGALLGSHDVVAFIKQHSVGDLDALLRRETLLVLFGAGTKPAAVDLESKLTEAALNRVQLADFRNFAHGRHHWLAKRSAESGVVAFSTASDRSLCSRTLKLLPPDVPQVTAHLSNRGPEAALLALIYSLGLVKLFGDARGIDPGRPGVPEFGRRIYHLRGFPVRKLARSVKLEHAAIRRKLSAAGVRVPAQTEIDFWRTALAQQLRALRSRPFDKIVFDYDGTLCSPARRFSGPGEELALQMCRLLGGGVRIGIATGRGRSVRRDLQHVLNPQHWAQVHIAYYNGAEIGCLDDETRPDASESPASDFAPVRDALLSDPQIRATCQCSVRPRQITLTANGHASGDRIWRLATECLRRHNLPEIRVVTSTHSVDVLAPGVTKLNLVHFLDPKPEAPPAPAILCIGDRGRWPGNDSELLAQPYSLSVDEVSADPASGWNLAPAGCRGTRATLFYLDLIAVQQSQFRLPLPEFSSS